MYPLLDPVQIPKHSSSTAYDKQLIGHSRALIVSVCVGSWPLPYRSRLYLSPTITVSYICLFILSVLNCLPPIKEEEIPPSV